MSDQPQPASAGKWTRKPLEITRSGDGKFYALEIPQALREDYMVEPTIEVDSDDKDLDVAKANAERLRDCWNACLGLDDPAAALAMARAVLAEVEWQERSGSSRYCPCCHEESRHGHMKTCKLAAALAALSGRETTT